MGEQAVYISECFPSLTETEVEEVFEEWAKEEYEFNAWNSALADLTTLLQRKTLSEEQLAEEEKRLAPPE
ncbi:MAG: hypothetical protein ACYSP9_05835 [Planctomycetota bacterium]